MRFKEKLQRFMTGRYGNDGFNKFLSFASIGLLLLSMVLRLFDLGGWINIFYFIALIMLVYCYIRMFSKDVQRRYAENIAYYRIVAKVKNKLNGVKARIAGQKNYKYFKCPQCKQQLRVPKGRGKIEITCPKCKTSFIKHS